MLLPIAVIVLMIGACWFVNDTKSKHGVCCGKGCAGCPIIEKDRKAKNKNYH